MAACTIIHMTKVHSRTQMHGQDYNNTFSKVYSGLCENRDAAKEIQGYH